MKTCIKCNEYKELELFIGNRCKACIVAYKKQWKANNADHVAKQNKEWKISNREHYLQSLKRIHADRSQDPNYIAKRCSNSLKWNAENPDKVAAAAKRYRIKHRDKVNASFNKRRKDDLGFRIASYLRSRLSHAIKNNHKNGSAVRDLGCSMKELKKHLESKFQPDMTWNNYGKWHIDHILPLASFDLKNPVQLKVACHHSNLQPLWAEDNRSKSNKVELLLASAP